MATVEARSAIKPGACCPECQGTKISACYTCAGVGTVGATYGGEGRTCLTCAGRGVIPCMTHRIAWENAQRIANRDGISKANAHQRQLQRFAEYAETGQVSAECIGA